MIRPSENHLCSWDGRPDATCGTSVGKSVLWPVETGSGKNTVFHLPKPQGDKKCVFSYILLYSSWLEYFSILIMASVSSVGDVFVGKQRPFINITLRMQRKPRPILIRDTLWSYLFFSIFRSNKERFQNHMCGSVWTLGHVCHMFVCFLYWKF